MKPQQIEKIPSICRVNSLFFFVLLMMSFAWSGCSKSPVVTIENQSSLTVSNVVVSGTGFTEKLDTIDPGKTRQIMVRPKGETGLRLSFDAGNKHVDSGSQDYFEGNGSYRVHAIIETNLTVNISTDLRKY